MWIMTPVKIFCLVIGEVALLFILLLYNAYEGQALGEFAAIGPFLLLLAIFLLFSGLCIIVSLVAIWRKQAIASALALLSLTAVILYVPISTPFLVEMDRWLRMSVVPPILAWEQASRAKSRDAKTTDDYQILEKLFPSKKYVLDVQGPYLLLDDGHVAVLFVGIDSYSNNMLPDFEHFIRHEVIERHVEVEVHLVGIRDFRALYGNVSPCGGFFGRCDYTFTSIPVNLFIGGRLVNGDFGGVRRSPPHDAIPARGGAGVQTPTEPRTLEAQHDP